MDFPFVSSIILPPSFLYPKVGHLFIEQRYDSVFVIDIPLRIFRKNLPLSLQASVFITKKYPCQKSQYLLLLYETKMTDHTDAAEEKKSHDYEKRRKNIETK